MGPLSAKGTTVKGSVHWGIVGTGRAARDFAEGLRHLPDARLVAACSPTPSSLERFKADFGVARGYSRAEDLAGDGGADIVYIATPPHRHAEDSLACLAAGRAVLCEKPFATSLLDATEVVEEARRAGVFCMEAMWTRWIPAIVRLRSLVASGAIGEVHSVVSDFSLPVARSGTEPVFRSGTEPVTTHQTSWLFDPQRGGGALLDRGVYGVSLSSMILGRPNRVSSVVTIGATGVDEEVAVLMQHRGAMAVVTASLRSRGSNEAMVIGSDATITIRAPFYVPERLTLVPGPGVATVQSDPAGIGPRLRQAARGRSIPGRARWYAKQVLALRATEEHPIRGNGYNYEAAEAQRCLRAGLLESPDMTLDESTSVIETLALARSSWVV